VKAKIYVTLKREVLDPQGDAVRRALRSLDLGGVEDVRVGKLIELELETDDRAEAERQLEQMCQRLLANPVMEDYRFELERASTPTGWPSWRCSWSRSARSGSRCGGADAEVNAGGARAAAPDTAAWSLSSRASGSARS